VRFVLCLLIFPVQLFGSSHSGWIGTYTSDGAKATGSRGIYSFEWDAKTGSLTEVRAVASTSNPTFLALHPNGRFLYAVNEDASASGTDRITAFAIDAARPSSALLEIGSVPSMGRAPCHLSIDAHGKWLFVANYITGSIAVYPIQADGRLAEAKQVIRQQGSGPVTGRQESAHAHEVIVSPDGRFLLAPDLGADSVFIYRFDSATGALAPNDPPAAKFLSGSGPRHLVFSKDGRFVYVITELVPAVVTLRWDRVRGSMTQISGSPTLLSPYDGHQGAAEIALHPNGKFLYASNRGGNNTITAFRLGHDGIPTQMDRVSSGGSIPRYFGIDPSGRFLIVANQGTGELVTFGIDAATGSLARRGTAVTVPAPADFLFVPTHRSH